MSVQLPQLKALEQRIEQLSEEINNLRKKNNNGSVSLNAEVKSHIEEKIRKLLDMLNAF